MIIMTLFPIVRKYTLTNNTNESLNVTLLMQFGVGAFSMEEIWEDEERKKNYIKQIDNLTILNQYLSYSPPALPAFTKKDININPNSKVVFYIDYEDIKQEGGPQILLIKDKQNNYYYKEANFWENDNITDVDLLNLAPENLIKAKDKCSGSFRMWFVMIFLLTLMLLPPIFLIKNIKLYRKEKKASLQL